MSEATFDPDEELRLRTYLLRRQRAEHIANFYRNGDGLHRLPLEEFTSSDIEDESEEDDETIRALAERQEEEELERALAENAEFEEIYGSEIDLDEEESGFRRPPSEVEGILQKLSRVEISRLKADDLECSICRSEYGKERGDKTKPASDSDQKLPDDELPESPVMLPCGHLLGDLCIYKWLEESQPASCPLCRHML